MHIPLPNWITCFLYSKVKVYAIFVIHKVHYNAKLIESAL